MSASVKQVRDSISWLHVVKEQSGQAESTYTAPLNTGHFHPQDISVVDRENAIIHVVLGKDLR